MSSEKPTYEREREAERLLAAANLHRMRGQFAEAEEKCKQALSIMPNDPVIHEMLGDLLHESGKLDAALAEYRAALDLAPGKPSAETKFAKVTLEIAEREREKALAKDMLENPHKYTSRQKNPGRALLFALIPGLGQFYNGDMVKALIIWGAFLLFFISWAIPHQYPRGIRTVGEFIYHTHPVVLLFGIIAFMAYIYGIVDAPISAGKSSKAPKNRID